jgi:O-glycosyl hydrolase
MKKKNLITMGILGLALILAINYAGCGLLLDNSEEEKKKGDDKPPPGVKAFITLDSSTKYQYVRGFGGMYITWDNQFEISLDEFDTMFSPDELGYNIMRIMINPIKGRGANVTPDGVTPEDKKYVHTTDPEEFLDFITTPNGGRPNYFEGVKKVNGYGGYVLASPWTPPAEWKSNGSVSTKEWGKLKEENYQDYADYLRKYAQGMSARGAPIYAISIQNEPNYSTERENYEGCMWVPKGTTTDGSQMRDFFKRVGNFTKAGTYTNTVSGTEYTATYATNIPGYGGGKALDYVLIMNGESANHPNLNDSALDDPASRNIIGLIGRHLYNNENTRYAKAINYGKEVWMTEHNLNSGAGKYANDLTWDYVWKFMNDVDVCIRLNDESAFVWWPLKRFYGFIGEGPNPACDTDEGEILPRGWGLSHYAKFAKEKDRIGVTVEGYAADDTRLNATNVNRSSFSVNSVDAKVTAFMSRDGAEISVVMYVPTNDVGAGSPFDEDGLGMIQIKLPDGFVAKSATAMRSNATAMGQEEEVDLSDTGKTAVVTLALSEILSVKFNK